MKSTTPLNIRHLTGLCILLSIVLVACTSTAPTESPPTEPESEESATTDAARAPTSLTVVQAADVQCLDPYVERLTHNYNITRHLFDQLAWVDRDLEVQPRLAESWDPVDDTTWDVTLREGVEFTNGEPVTASDVVASLEYALDSPSETFFASWDRAEAIDDTTVRIFTKFPDPAFAPTLTRVFVFPASVIEADPESQCTEPVGSGPYQLVEWVRGDHMTLEAIDGHFLEPNIEQITVRAAPETSARVSMLLSGEADLIVNVPSDSISQIDESGVARVVSVPGIRRATNIIDTRDEPLDDVRVRRAMAHAVDMDSIVENILGDYGTRAIAALPPLSPAANPDLEPYSYDPDMARSLLTEAGYPDGFEMDYHYPTGRWLKDAEVAQAIAGYLEEIGITVNLLTTEYETFFGEWSSGEYSGMTMIGTIVFDSDPGSTYRLFLHSDGPWAFSWSDPDMDELSERSDREMDLESRMEQFQQMEAIIHEEAIWCCGYDQHEVFGVANDLDYRPHPGERVILWDARWE